MCLDASSAAIDIDCYEWGVTLWFAAARSLEHQWEVLGLSFSVKDILVMGLEMDYLMNAFSDHHQRQDRSRIPPKSSAVANLHVEVLMLECLYVKECQKAVFVNILRCSDR